MKRNCIVAIVLSALLFPFAACTHQPSVKDVSFVKGADIGWLTQVEDDGQWQYMDTLGQPVTGLELLDQLGVNTVRLRVWVNPKPAENGHVYCDVNDVVRQAVRATRAGYEVMIDFHYSNWWADPGQQHCPAEWHAAAMAEAEKQQKALLQETERMLDDSAACAVGLISVVCDSVRAHTAATLSALKKAGVTPRWVQIGNEIPNGFMHPYGKADEHPDWFAQLFLAGYEAAKSVFPDIICMLHIDNGYDLARTTFIADILHHYNVPFDMMGWSLYPAMNWVTGEVDTNWQRKVDLCLANADSMFVRYGKESMLVEIGMPDCDEQVGADCIAYTIRHAGPHLHGLIWWEPVTPPDYSYRMGAMKDVTGQYASSSPHQCAANAALRAFTTPSPR